MKFVKELVGMPKGPLQNLKKFSMVRVLVSARIGANIYIAYSPSTRPSPHIYTLSTSSLCYIQFLGVVEKTYIISLPKNPCHQAPTKEALPQSICKAKPCHEHVRCPWESAASTWGYMLRQSLRQCWGNKRTVTSIRL